MGSDHDELCQIIRRAGVLQSIWADYPAYIDATDATVKFVTDFMGAALVLTIKIYAGHSKIALQVIVGDAGAPEYAMGNDVGRHFIPWWADDQVERVAKSVTIDGDSESVTHDEYLIYGQDSENDAPDSAQGINVAAGRATKAQVPSDTAPAPGRSADSNSAIAAMIEEKRKAATIRKLRAMDAEVNAIPQRKCLEQDCRLMVDGGCKDCQRPVCYRHSENFRCQQCHQQDQEEQIQLQSQDEKLRQ